MKGKEVGEGEDKRNRKGKQLGGVRKAKKPSVVSSPDWLKAQPRLNRFVMPRTRDNGESGTATSENCMIERPSAFAYFRHEVDITYAYI